MYMEEMIRVSIDEKDQRWKKLEEINILRGEVSVSALLAMPTHAAKQRRHVWCIIYMKDGRIKVRGVEVNRYGCREC